MKKATKYPRPIVHISVCQCRLPRSERLRAPTMCQSSSSPISTPQLFQKCLLMAGAVFLSLSVVTTPLQVEARVRLGSDEQRVVDIFNKSTSSVVNITNLSSRRDAFTSDMQDYPQGAGSGIVWDKQGHIVVRCLSSLNRPSCMLMNPESCHMPSL
jgi:hypothetical protein